MVEPWTASTSARERVETIAETLSEPRTANWVAEQAEVEWDTANRHLEDLVDRGVLLKTDDGRYVPDPTRAYFDRLRELILTNERSELRAELQSIAERIQEWQSTYGVESVEELEASLADDRSPEEVRERRRAIRRWETSVESREAIRTALVLYDDVQSLTEGVSGTLGVDTAG